MRARSTRESPAWPLTWPARRSLLIMIGRPDERAWGWRCPCPSHEPRDSAVTPLTESDRALPRTSSALSLRRKKCLL